MLPNQKRLVFTGLILLTVLAGILGGIIIHFRDSKELKVVFLDVGQGDAILISQGGNQLLIDGGRSGNVILEKLGSYIPFWDRNIEAVLATHPDQDHIGGLVDVLKNYKVGTVLRTRDTSTSQAFAAFDAEAKKTQEVEALQGIAINFPEGPQASVLYPLESFAGNQEENTNDFSVVMKLVWGENKFLFTGDLPFIGEGLLLQSEANLESNVLKLAHHGSKYATSSAFLSKVDPKEVIISVGKNNTYGHPNEDVLDRIRKIGSKIFRTDQQGDIVYTCKSQSDICEISTYAK